MMRMAAAIGVLLLGVATAFGAGLGATHGANKTATVGVTIHVLPQAWIEFPYGFDFVLTVPEEKNKNFPEVILPVLIPFKGYGNTLASVTALPGDFIHIKAGPYLGEAVNEGGDTHKNQTGLGHEKAIGNGHHKGEGDTIGYNIIVQFPLPSWTGATVGSWDGFGGWRSGFASLPGLDGQGTPPLSANLSQNHDGRLGMIYIIAKDYWTDDGKRAIPGKYRGTIQMTVTAEQR